MGTISLKATPINQDGNFRTFRQARGFLGFFAGEYPRHFYSTLTEPERVPARREIRMFCLLNEFFNAGPSFNTENTPC